MVTAAAAIVPRMATATSTVLHLRFVDEDVINVKPCVPHIIRLAISRG